MPIDDRGLTFADSLYEGIRCYRGQAFRWDAHMDRLARACRELEIAMPDRGALHSAALELLQRNGLGEAFIYLQVTRGVSPRGHVAPDGLKPTVFMSARPVLPVDADRFARGGTVITVPDRRWERCDLKTTGLLLNTLAKRDAERQGAVEAAFVRNGVVTEGGSTNLFAVIDGVLRTHPNGPHILPGITRDVVLQLARDTGVRVAEEAFTPDEFRAADEAFLTSTTMEVFPLLAVDGHVIGSGTPGPVTTQLWHAFRQAVDAECPG